MSPLLLRRNARGEATKKCINLRLDRRTLQWILVRYPPHHFWVPAKTTESLAFEHHCSPCSQTIAINLSKYMSLTVWASLGENAGSKTFFKGPYWPCIVRCGPPVSVPLAGSQRGRTWDRVDTKVFLLLFSLKWNVSGDLQPCSNWNFFIHSSVWRYSALHHLGRDLSDVSVGFETHKI